MFGRGEHVVFFARGVASRFAFSPLFSARACITVLFWRLARFLAFRAYSYWPAQAVHIVHCATQSHSPVNNSYRNDACNFNKNSHYYPLRPGRCTKCKKRRHSSLWSVWSLERALFGLNTVWRVSAITNIVDSVGDFFPLRFCFVFNPTRLASYHRFCCRQSACVIIFSFRRKKVTTIIVSLNLSVTYAARK